MYRHSLRPASGDGAPNAYAVRVRSDARTRRPPMSKHLCLLSISVVASSTVACGSPHPPDLGADGGSDGAAISPIVASNTVTRADLATGIAPLVVPAGATFVFDTDQGAMYDAGNGNAPIRIAGPGVQDGVFYRSDDQNRAFFAVQSL